MHNEDSINFEELLVRYLQHTASEDDLRRLLEMVQQSEDNRRELVRQKSVYDYLALRTEAHRYPAASGWEKLLAQIEAEEQAAKVMEPELPGKVRTFTIKRVLPLLSYAAVLLLALLCGMQYLWYHQERMGIAGDAYTEFVVEKGGGKSSLLLPDGTKVLLNAGTTLRYPTRFAEKERNVYLEGEGYFEVTENKQKPFVVKLQGYDVKVLGTVFNVKAYPDMSYSTTTLVSGKVHLTSYDEKGSVRMEQVLYPEETASIDRQTGAITTARSDTEMQLAWKQGLYKFKDKPLEEIAAELERMYDVEIGIEDERLAQSRYTGSFVLENTIEEVLKPFGQYHKFRYEKNGRNIRIFSTINN